MRREEASRSALCPSLPSRVTQPPRPPLSRRRLPACPEPRPSRCRRPRPWGPAPARSCSPPACRCRRAGRSARSRSRRGRSDRGRTTSRASGWPRPSSCSGSRAWCPPCGPAAPGIGRAPRCTARSSAWCPAAPRRSQPARHRTPSAGAQRAGTGCAGRPRPPPRAPPASVRAASPKLGPGRSERAAATAAPRAASRGGDQPQSRFTARRFKEQSRRRNARSLPPRLAGPPPSRPPSGFGAGAAGSGGRQRALGTGTGRDGTGTGGVGGSFAVGAQLF